MASILTALSFSAQEHHSHVVCCTFHQGLAFGMALLRNPKDCQFQSR